MLTRGGPRQPLRNALFSCGQLLRHGRGLGSFPHNAGSVSLFRPIAVKAFGLAISPALIARADPIALAVGSTALEMPLEADRTELMLLWSAI